MATKVLTFGNASVEVSLHGAHVMRWITEGGQSPLYLSPDAVFTDGKAIRGGIPVCWPQFSDMGPLRVHGFARTSMWSHLGTVSAPDNSQMTFVLDTHTAAELGEAAAFEVSLVVTLWSMALEVELRVRNDGMTPISFTTALHTYYSVSDIDSVEIHGLDNVPYADNLQAKVMQPAAEIRVIDREVDRNYYETKGAPVEVRDTRTGVSTVVTSSASMPDSVLWNPWVEKAKRMGDLPDDGFKSFVCVESGAIHDRVVLAPDLVWSGKQTSRVSVAAPPPASSL